MLPSVSARTVLGGGTAGRARRNKVCRKAGNYTTKLVPSQDDPPTAPKKLPCGMGSVHQRRLRVDLVGPTCYRARADSGRRPLFGEADVRMRANDVQRELLDAAVRLQLGRTALSPALRPPVRQMTTTAPNSGRGRQPRWGCFRRVHRSKKCWRLCRDADQTRVCSGHASR